MNEFQDKVLDLMLARAAEIGDWSMVREVCEVTARHIECCRLPADAPLAIDELEVVCFHEAGRAMSTRDGKWHCATCDAVLP